MDTGIGQLKFDEIKMDHKLAYEYFEQHNKRFHSTGLPEGTKEIRVIDLFQNEIFASGAYNGPSVIHSISHTSDRSKTLRDLADSIEQNAPLFCDLESLIRGIPNEDVLKRDIKLLTQQLRHKSLYKENSSNTVLRISETSPLYMLGGVVDSRTILCEIKTAPVCHLFTELCGKAGLDVHYIILSTSLDVKKGQKDDFEEHCTAVITANADLDSAVDALLESTTLYPWKLKTLFIQENICEAAMKVFDWKCKKENDVDGYAKLCSAVYLYGTKIFLFDYGGDATSVQKGAVLVQCYRTNKELLSLLSSIQPTYSSLWSNDIAEAKEIASGILPISFVVWVNNIGVVDGPSRASNAFYSSLNIQSSCMKIYQYPAFTKALKIRESWMQKDITKRVEIINGLLKAFKLPWSDLLPNFYEEDSFAYLGEDRECTGQRQVMPMYLDFVYKEVIMELVKGGVVLYEPNNNQPLSNDVAENLAKVGAPLVFCSPKKSQNFVYGCSKPVYVTRIIYQYFGTTFAN